MLCDWLEILAQIRNLSSSEAFFCVFVTLQLVATDAESELFAYVQTNLIKWPLNHVKLSLLGLIFSGCSRNEIKCGGWRSLVVVVVGTCGDGL